MTSCCFPDREREALLLRDRDETDEEYLKMFPQNKNFCAWKKWAGVLSLLFICILSGLLVYYLLNGSKSPETSTTTRAYLAVVNATIWTADRSNLYADAILVK